MGSWECEGHTLRGDVDQIAGSLLLISFWVFETLLPRWLFSSPLNK